MYKNESTIPGKGPCPGHILKKQNVPFAALEQIDEELNRLEKAGI